MRVCRHIGLALVLVGSLWAGEVIDRILATVNGVVLLKSDVDQAIRFEAFMEGRPPESMVSADRAVALNRLVDQELLRQQMQQPDFNFPVEKRLQQKLAELRKQYPGAETEAGWKSALDRYGLTEADAMERIESQLELLRFIETRLRPGVHVDTSSIEIYYRENLVPELKKSGAKVPALKEVSEKIRELLMQRGIDEQLTVWLRNLRSQGDIHTDFPPNGVIKLADKKL